MCLVQLGFEVGGDTTGFTGQHVEHPEADAKAARQAQVLQPLAQGAGGFLRRGTGEAVEPYLQHFRMQAHRQGLATFRQEG